MYFVQFYLIKLLFVLFTQFFKLKRATVNSGSWKSIGLQSSLQYLAWSTWKEGFISKESVWLHDIHAQFLFCLVFITCKCSSLCVILRTEEKLFTKQPALRSTKYKYWLYWAKVFFLYQQLCYPLYKVSSREFRAYIPDQTCRAKLLWTNFCVCIFLGITNWLFRIGCS